jgi:L-threonylcarbamoyladenylate synthase
VTIKISSKDKISYKIAAEVVKGGGIAIVPTDTVYGFAINAFNIKAQKMVYKIKGRSYNKPLILMVPDIESARILVEIPQKAMVIARKFWPGQLTLILPTTNMGKILSGGRKDLGIRIPNSKFMLRFLKEIGGPIFTTSVNASGKKSAKNVNEILDFKGTVNIIVDGGQCKFSFESTVIDMLKFPYVIIRRGCFDINKLLKYI